MKVAVVILNWNTAGYLKSFLPPLLKSVEGLDAQVVVADNGSTDSSSEVLEGCFPQVRTIALDRNYGFTGGYNRAIAALDGFEYVVLMNSDIEAPAGWLEPLVEFMDSHAECGVCGPKLHALTPERGQYVRSSRFEYAGAAGGFLDRYGFPFCQGRVLSRTEEDRGQYDSPRRVMWTTGACLMTRVELWKRLGGLDERFFAHMEEIDYCWRVQLSGMDVCVVPQSCVYHLGGGTLPQSSPFKLKLNYRNSILMLRKNLPATIGPGKAARRIAMRLMIDRCAACVYLLSGRLKEFRAVADAHREAAAMEAEVSAGQGRPEGPSDVCILVQGLLRGSKIFEYLRNRL